MTLTRFRMVVTVQGEDAWNRLSRNESLAPPASRISGLTPFSRYALKARICNSVGCNETTQDNDFRTRESSMFRISVNYCLHSLWIRIYTNLFVTIGIFLRSMRCLNLSACSYTQCRSRCRGIIYQHVHAPCRFKCPDSSIVVT